MADTEKDLRETMNGCGLCLASIDTAVRKAQGFEGPPGSGLHRLLTMLAAQLGIRVNGFPSSPETPLPAEATDVERKVYSGA